MAIELVVFDMAGTTVKDKNYVGLAFQKAMQSHGYEVAIEQVNPIMGYEKPLAISMMLEMLDPEKKSFTDETVNRIHDVFVNEMIEFYSTTDQIAPLPNAEQTFSLLKENGIKVALNTGFSRDIADVIVKRLGWEDKIDLLVASDEVPKGRPFPYMINKAIEILGIESSAKVAKVGDTEVDINEGFNASCKYVIGVTTGAFTREELAIYNPTHIIDNLLEVINIISVNNPLSAVN